LQIPHVVTQGFGSVFVFNRYGSRSNTWRVRYGSNMDPDPKPCFNLRILFLICKFEFFLHILREKMAIRTNMKNQYSCVIFAKMCWSQTSNWDRFYFYILVHTVPFHGHHILNIGYLKNCIKILFSQDTAE